VAGLVYDGGQNLLTQTELMRPVHGVVAERTGNRPGEHGGRVPCHEPGDSQGKPTGRHGMNQQVAAAFSLPQARFRRLESKVQGDVQEHRYHCRSQRGSPGQRAR